ncbi:MAG: creatininase family protein [Calditrichaeota bacterium]|nr:MAG: creatininase family protein [Calditrichota bacterium]
MPPRPYILKETNWKSAQKTEFEVAVLPWGATEAHNYHLPYGTDIYETEAVADESAKKAWENGARIIVLPAIPFGINTQQMDIPLTINMNPATQAAVLIDVIDSLESHDIKKLVILNGHGGNDFKNMIRTAQRKTSIFLCQVNWFAITEMEGLFSESGDHANEMETSLMQHISPQLVLPLSDAGDGAAKRFKIKGLREKWAWAPRQWTQVTFDTGVGNPRKATKEKGEAYFDQITTEIADFFLELNNASPDSMYE